MPYTDQDYQNFRHEQELDVLKARARRLQREQDDLAEYESINYETLLTKIEALEKRVAGLEAEYLRRTE